MSLAVTQAIGMNNIQSTCTISRLNFDCAPGKLQATTMKASIFYLTSLMLCYHVMSKEAPSASPPTDSECPFIDFTCPPGLPTTSDTFSQSDVCEPLFNRTIAGAGTLIFIGARPVAFKCKLVCSPTLMSGYCIF